MHNIILPVKYVLYFYIITFRSMCAVPNMAVVCSPLISCFPDMLLRYCLSDHEIVPVTPITSGITFALLLLLLLLLHKCMRHVDVFCLLQLFTYGVASFIAC
jgi:hypothetical protein